MCYSVMKRCDPAAAVFFLEHIQYFTLLYFYTLEIRKCVLTKCVIYNHEIIDHLHADVIIR